MPACIVCDVPQFGIGSGGDGSVCRVGLLVDDHLAVQPGDESVFGADTNVKFNAGAYLRVG
jgi:hypothetical protein